MTDTPQFETRNTVAFLTNTIDSQQHDLSRLNSNNSNHKHLNINIVSPNPNSSNNSTHNLNLRESTSLNLENCLYHIDEVCNYLCTDNLKIICAECIINGE